MLQTDDRRHIAITFTFAKKEIVSTKNEAKVTGRVGCVSEQELILASCCLSPMRRNSVLDELGTWELRDWQLLERSV